jgi:hypothetical protein
MVLAFAALSCGSGDSQSESVTDTTPTKTSAHAPTEELQAKIIADTTDDLNLVAGAGKDVSVLPQAMKGSALQETTASTNQDLAQGKYKTREYQTMDVRLDSYNFPLAQVVVEFDDYGYYVDANTGEALGEPTQEHHKIDLALSEEDGRWKIQTILAPSNASTPSAPVE